MRETENSHRTHLGRSDDAGVLLETCAYCETQIAAGASATLIGLLVPFWPFGAREIWYSNANALTPRSSKAG